MLGLAKLGLIYALLFFFFLQFFFFLKKKPYIRLAKKKKMQNEYLIGRAKKHKLNVVTLFKEAILFFYYFSHMFFLFFPNLFPLFKGNWLFNLVCVFYGNGFLN